MMLYFLSDSLVMLQSVLLDRKCSFNVHSVFEPIWFKNVMISVIRDKYS